MVISLYGRQHEFVPNKRDSTDSILDCRVRRSNNNGSSSRSGLISPHTARYRHVNKLTLWERNHRMRSLPPWWRSRCHLDPRSRGSLNQRSERSGKHSRLVLQSADRNGTIVGASGIQCRHVDWKERALASHGLMRVSAWDGMGAGYSWTRLQKSWARHGCLCGCPIENEGTDTTYKGPFTWAVC